MTTKGNARVTPGEAVVAILIASVIALLLAIGGFVAAIWFCGVVFTGEATESALILAPLAAILVGITSFVLVYRWFVRYGSPSDGN